MLDRDSSVPIYIQIQEHLEEMLQSGALKPNELVPSENEMAEKLKVSRLTVRKSYGEMVKRGMFFTIQGKGTYVKELRPTPKMQSDEDNSVKKVIGVIFPEVHGFYSDIFQSIQDQCAAAHKSVQLMFNNEIQNEITAIQQMIVSGVEGIIISPSRHSNTVVEHYQKLVNSPIPTVMVGKAPFKISAPAVFCDETLGAYRAVELLIAHGNTNIAYVTNSNYEDEAQQERYSGCATAMIDYLGVEPAVTLDVSSPRFEQELVSAVEKISVTAFFCSTDQAAAIVYGNLIKIGKRVPEEVEIIGYDNTDAPRIYGVEKQITSVDQRRELLGVQVTELLWKLMKNGEPSHSHIQIVVHPKIVHKETTRAE